jgi:hypothetical protein
MMSTAQLKERRKTHLLGRPRGAYWAALVGVFVFGFLNHFPSARASIVFAAEASHTAHVVRSFVGNAANHERTISFNYGPGPTCDEDSWIITDKLAPFRVNRRLFELQDTRLPRGERFGWWPMKRRLPYVWGENGAAPLKIDERLPCNDPAIRFAPVYNFDCASRSSGVVRHGNGVCSGKPFAINTDHLNEKLRSMCGIKFGAGESNLAPNENALDQRPDSKSNSEKGQPKRIISDGIFTAPVPQGFGFWACLITGMALLCLIEAHLIVFLIDRDGYRFGTPNNPAHNRRKQDKKRQ